MSVSTISQRPLSVPSEATLRDQLGTISRQKWFIMVIFAITLGVATGFAQTMPPVYVASSALVADKAPPVILLTNSGQLSLFAQQPEAPDVSTLTELVKSDAVRNAAMDRLTSTMDPQDVKAAFRRIRVQQVRSTDVVRISAAHADPQTAAAVANAIAESVIDMDLNARRRSATQARQFIGEQLALEAQKLRAGETALATFKSLYRTVSLSEETVLNLRELADLEHQLTDVRLQQREAQTGFARQASINRQTSLGLTRRDQDPVIVTLQSQLATLEVELSGLRKIYTSRAPAVISTEAKIEEIKSKLGTEVAGSQSVLAARKRALSGAIATLERKLLQVPTHEVELARLTRDTKEAERNYMLLSEKFQEARVAEGSIGSAVRLVDIAKAPDVPDGPKRSLTILLGGVGGLILGVVGAFVMEQLDDTVKSPDEATRLLGAPVLGTVPMLGASDTAPSQDKGKPLLLTQFNPGSFVAESFRVLRTHVLRAMPNSQQKCLLITSALPRAGKSTVTANLAVAMAQTDRRVLLVDCDLRHPTMKDLFPEADSPGLSALLVGHATVDEVVRPTADPHLQCVVSGPVVPNPAELLDAELTKQFIMEARDRADVIFLDSPAVLPVTDAEVIGLHTDGAVVVVQLGKTDRSALVETQKRLEHAGVKVVGIVLNTAPTDRRHRY